MTQVKPMLNNCYHDTVKLSSLFKLRSTTFHYNNGRTICKIVVSLNQFIPVFGVCQKAKKIEVKDHTFIGIAIQHPSDKEDKKKGEYLAEHRALVQIYAFEREYLKLVKKDVKGALAFLDESILKITEKQNKQRNIIKRLKNE